MRLVSECLYCGAERSLSVSAVVTDRTSDPSYLDRRTTVHRRFRCSCGRRQSVTLVLFSCAALPGESPDMALQRLSSCVACDD